MHNRQLFVKTGGYQAQRKACCIAVRFSHPGFIGDRTDGSIMELPSCAGRFSAKLQSGLINFCHQIEVEGGSAGHRVARPSQASARRLQKPPMI